RSSKSEGPLETAYRRCNKRRTHAIQRAVSLRQDRLYGHQCRVLPDILTLRLQPYRPSVNKSHCPSSESCAFAERSFHQFLENGIPLGRGRRPCLLLGLRYRNKRGSLPPVHASSKM